MKQKSNRYTVKTVLMSHGERLPALLDNGMPLFDANMYAISEIRGRNLASSTMIQALRAVLILYIFLDEHKIDLRERLKEGLLLAPNEIEALAVYCRMPMAQMATSAKHISTDKAQRKIIHFEQARQRLACRGYDTVCPAFTLTRLLYIRNYLLWLINNKIARHGLSANYRRQLLDTRDSFSRIITARLPRKDRRGDAGREGLTPEEQKLLLETVRAGGKNSPWSEEHARMRNELIVIWLLLTGTRRGELLNIRIRDISFQKREVFITRRADDAEDPRKNQPLSKTDGRQIPVSDGLLALTQKYITELRSTRPWARKHNYLFVSDEGMPLSLSSFTKVFATLRDKRPAIPQNLCGHVLRHTWNENFSDHCDANGVSDEEEMRWREALQGWKQGSGSAAYYCKRGIRKRAEEASLKLQARLEEEFDVK